MFSSLYVPKVSFEQESLIFALLLSECRLSLHPATQSRNGKEPSSRRASDRSEPYKHLRSAPAPGNAGKADSRRRKAGDDSNRSSRTRVKTPGTTAPVAGRSLACLLYKFNPVEHRGCLLKNHLTSTSFVVQHMLRSHEHQPVHCPTCGVVFDSREACNTHITQQQCSSQPFDHPGLTEDQLNVLRNPPRERRRLDEEARWFDIWDGMFPTSARPESAYVLEEQQELLNIIRRAIHIARRYGYRTSESDPPGRDWAWGYETMPEWGFIRDHIIPWPFYPGQVPVDLSFLSSDGRLPHNVTNALIFQSNAGRESPSDMLPLSQSRWPTPLQVPTNYSDMGLEQTLDTSAFASSSLMSSSQPVFSTSLGSDDHSLGGSSIPHLRPRSSENPPLSGMMPEDHPEIDSDLCHYSNLSDCNNDIGPREPPFGT